MIDFTDNPDQKTIDERVKKIKDLTGNDEVFNATEFCVDCVKVYDIMDAVALDHHGRVTIPQAVMGFCRPKSI